MLARFIAILKEKKLYGLVVGVGAFLLLLLVERVFTIGVVLVPALVFFLSRYILKSKLKGTGQLLTNALAIQIAHYIIILLAAFQQPLTYLVDFFIIFWGTYWFYKKPSWKSSGLMIGYNVFRLFVFYLRGASQAISEQSITNIRSAAFAILLAVSSICLIYSAVRAVKKQQLTSVELANREDNPTTE